MQIIFFCRVLDIRVTGIVYPNLFYAGLLAALRHFIIQPAFGVGKQAVIFPQLVAPGHVVLQALTEYRRKCDPVPRGTNLNERSVQIMARNDERDRTCVRNIGGVTCVLLKP